MSVNWRWNEKKGEVIWRNKTTKEIGFKWIIYNANCMGAFIRFLDAEEKTYQFELFLGEPYHAKRVLGLIGKDNDNLFDRWYLDYEIDHIKLDTSYYQWELLTKYFTSAGYEVRCYKGIKE